jgi:hypothetical protein
MKKYFLILLLALISGVAFADDHDDDYSNQGVISDIIEENISDDDEKDDEDEEDDEDVKKYRKKTPQEIKKPVVVKSKLELTNRLVFEVGMDDNYQSANRQNEFKDTYSRTRLISKLNVYDKFTLNSYLTFSNLDNESQIVRRNASLNGGGDRSFENMGVVVQELNITKNSKNYSLVAGKFNPNFGNAWAWNRGIWIHDIANQNYRQVEKLGFAGIYRLGNAEKTGQYSFGLSAFTNDRKNLDNSLMNKRDSDSKSDARAGDSRSLESYLATIDINFDFKEREKLSYHFSYLNLAVNQRVSQVPANKVDDQKNFALNLNYQYPLSEKMLLNGFLEYVEVKNLNGNSNIGERYLTANLITKFDNWSLLLGNSKRQNLQLATNGFDQNLTEISLGYEFTKNSFFDRLTIQAGYKNFRNDQRTSLDSQNSLGFLVRYYKNF